MQSYLVLALAALSSALPQPRSAALADVEFGLTMRMGEIEMPLKAIPNSEDSNSYYIVAAGLGKAYSGSFYYTNGTNPHAALNVDFDGVSYGLSVPDVGEVDGAAVPILATKGYQDFGFSVGGEVDHSLTAADQQWLVCNRTVSGYTGPVLAWGQFYANGSYAEGCEPSAVFQYCNIGARGSGSNSC